MKICPKCQTEYDDEEMRFCIKDGTALTTVETAVDNHVSASAVSPAEPAAARDRFVVSLEEPPKSPPNQPPTTVVAPVKPVKKKSFAALFAALAVLLLLFFGAGLGAAAYFLLPGRTEVAATNQNAAANVGQTESNGGLSNLDVFNTLNTNSNSSQNINQNANVKPSPSPKPSVSPSPANKNGNGNVNSNANASANINANANQANPVINANAAPSPTPAATPIPIASAAPTVDLDRVYSGGVMSSKATSLPKPPYPPAARQAGASGAVNVQIVVDRDGRVISATATSGHALLRQAAVQAARQARFQPTMISGQPVKVSGVIVYNFVPD